MISLPPSSAEYVKAGRLTEALQLLQNEIRINGADARLRIFLIQLLCLLGNWERAHRQLEALEAFGEEFKGWSSMLAQALLGERLRRSVFAGETTPLVLGEPSPWIAVLIRALAMDRSSAQASLRRDAFHAASTIPVNVNGIDLPWLADADSRLGPVFEGILDGKYYWIPMDRIVRMTIKAPTDLRHLIWSPAEVTWVTGGESTLLIPVRYPGSELVSDDRVRLSRLTTWEDHGDGQFCGLGQRLLVSGKTELPWLEIRQIEFFAV